MKGILSKILFFILGFVSMSSVTHAFLGEDMGLDLYKNIDEGFEELQNKQYEHELKGGENSIKDYINKVYGKNCIEKNLSSSDINSITNGDIGLLVNKMGSECKISESSTTIETINELKQLIASLNQSSQEIAEEKSERILEIAQIGIYTDGIRENSGFDLFSDLEDIDKIIFSQKNEYIGEDYSNIDERLDKLIGSSSNNGNKDNGGNSVGENEGNNGDDTNGSESGSDSSENEVILGDHNYVCSYDNNLESGLSLEALEELLGGSDNNSSNSNESNETGRNDNSEEVVESGTHIEDEVSTYKKVDDNEGWPCSDFFCIIVDYVTYSHALFIGGEDISIEFLIKRSNNHLKKFANSSLIQAKMTTNNFELGLKDLNLPDLFHMGFVIQYKPIPLLSVNKIDTENKTSDEFSSDNMLRNYYKALNLDYDRRNDMSIFMKDAEDRKTIIDSAELTNEEVAAKWDGYIQESGSLIINQEAEHIHKSLIKKVSFEDTGDFDKQFIEIMNFSQSMNDYVNSLHEIIKKMQEIPIG